ncbi:hypothetical protein Tco_1110738 [Tanacetum coccineum]|uniref:Transposase MuDR plant domain-containing protein n=1 Tax=Tanacetum coccineum TaxID=301880 RepID=A0ABQ5IL64_9ASTR
MSSNIKNFKCLIHFNETQRGSILSEDLTYSMLHEMVMQKFKLEANAVINLSFKLSSFDFAVDITDDAEVQFFVGCACNSNDEFAHLFVSEQKNNQKNMFFNFFESPTLENEGPSNQEIPSSHLNNSYNKTSFLNNGISFDLRQNDFHINDSLHLQNEPHFSNPESSFDFRSNEYNTDDVVNENPQNKIHKWQKFMSFEPDIPETPVYKAKPIISKQYSQQSEVEKGKIFDNKESLILAVRLKALSEGFQFLTDRSDPERCYLKCYNFAECDWYLRATLWDNTKKYYITYLNDVHTCSKTQTYPNHRNANKKVIGHLLTPKLQDRSRVLRGKDIQQDILSEYKIHISYQQAMKGKHYGIQQLAIGLQKANQIQDFGPTSGIRAFGGTLMMMRHINHSLHLQNEPHFSNPESSFDFRSNEYNTYDVVNENPQNKIHKWQKFMSFEPDIPKTPVYKAKPNISKQYSQQSKVEKGKIFDNKESLILAVSDDEASNHEDASDTGAEPKQQQQAIPQTTAISNIKLPILKKDEYDIWSMEMEHYLEYIDNEVWKVIQNGNSKKRISTGKDGVVRILPPVTAAEIQAVEKERKAKNILLMAIPKEHMRRFHGMDDAKEIWEAIRTRFGDLSTITFSFEAHGAEVSTKDANHKFLRSLPPAWSNLAMTMRTKPDVDTLSIDDLYNDLRVLSRRSKVPQKHLQMLKMLLLFHKAKAVLIRLSLVSLVPTVLALLLLLQSIFLKKKLCSYF